MTPNTLNNPFDQQTLADDFLEVRRIYAEFFATINETDWEKPVKDGSKEWTLHETVAHLVAAIVVLVVAGPARLSRTEAMQISKFGSLNWKSQS